MYRSHVSGPDFLPLASRTWAIEGKAKASHSNVPAALRGGNRRIRPRPPHRSQGRARASPTAAPHLPGGLPDPMACTLPSSPSFHRKANSGKSDPCLWGEQGKLRQRPHPGPGDPRTCQLSKATLRHTWPFSPALIEKLSKN